jgi:hypothetical protein
MAIESDKVMFEIYRDPAYAGRHCVVYFTELNDRNRELGFNHALRGDHVFDGFLRNYGKEEAKRLIAGILDRLNRGDTVESAEIRELLREYMP